MKHSKLGNQTGAIAFNQTGAIALNLLTDAFDSAIGLDQ